MHAVNLLPRQLAAPRRPLPPLALIGAAAVPLVAIVLVVIGYSSAHSTVAAEKAKFDALQAQVAALGGATSVTTKTAAESAAAAATAAKWNALISERTSRRAELDDVLEQELPWDVMLRDVARLLPSGVWLTQLGFQSPVTLGASSTSTTSSSSSSTTSNNFTITGYSETETSVALLLVRLQLLPTLSDVSLGTTSNTTVGSKNVVQFTVTAAIQAPASAGLPTSPTTTPAATTTTTTTTPTTTTG